MNFNWKKLRNERRGKQKVREDGKALQESVRVGKEGEWGKKGDRGRE